MSMCTVNNLSKEKMRPTDCNIGIYMRRSLDEIPADQDPEFYCRWLYGKKYRTNSSTHNHHFYIDICGRAEITKCPQMLKLMRDCMIGKIDLVFAESVMRVDPNMMTMIFWLYFLLHLDHKIEIEIDAALNTRTSTEQRQDIIRATYRTVHANYVKYGKWETDVLSAIGVLDLHPVSWPDYLLDFEKNR